MKKSVIVILALMAVGLIAVMIPVGLRLDSAEFENFVWQSFGLLQEGETVEATLPDGSKVTVDPSLYPLISRCCTITERGLRLLDREPQGEKVYMTIGASRWLEMILLPGGEETVVRYSENGRLFCYTINETLYRSFERVTEALTAY